MILGRAKHQARSLEWQHLRVVGLVTPSNRVMYEHRGPRSAALRGILPPKPEDTALDEENGHSAKRRKQPLQMRPSSPTSTSWRGSFTPRTKRNAKGRRPASRTSPRFFWDSAHATFLDPAPLRPSGDARLAQGRSSAKILMIFPKSNETCSRRSPFCDSVTMSLPPGDFVPVLLHRKEKSEKLRSSQSVSSGSIRRREPWRISLGYLPTPWKVCGWLLAKR